MPPDDHQAEVRKRLTKIEQKVDSIMGNVRWLVRADTDRLLPALLNDFGMGERRIGVYLAVNGERSVNEIADHVGMIAYNVSIELAWLKDRDLVSVVGFRGQEKIYEHEEFDGIVGLTRQLKKRLQEIQTKKAKGAKPTTRGKAKKSRK
jgi:hypothetical protein